MVLKSLRTWFVSGLLLLAPVGVTLFVVNILIVRVGQPVRQIFEPWIKPALLENYAMEWLLNVASLVLVVVLISLLGWFSQLLLGRIFVKVFERTIDALPFVRTVYNTVKQIRDTFVQQNKAIFQKTVLVEFPRKGTWAIGFLTSDARGEVQHRTTAELINVFVPTTPNPTSGFLIMVPKDDIIELEMTVADAMKVIISGGAVVPRYDPATGTSTSMPLPDALALGPKHPPAS